MQARVGERAVQDRSGHALTSTSHLQLSGLSSCRESRRSPRLPCRTRWLSRVYGGPKTLRFGQAQGEGEKGEGARRGGRRGGKVTSGFFHMFLAPERVFMVGCPSGVKHSQCCACLVFETAVPQLRRTPEKEDPSSSSSHLGIGMQNVRGEGEGEGERKRLCSKARA